MYCGSCPVYRASHDKDDKAILEISFKTRCTVDQVKCEGCGTSGRFPLSTGCVYRKCARGRGLEVCSQCQEFPCDALKGFDGEDMRKQAEAEKNARRMKEVGVDQWLEEADTRWRCKHCDSKISLDAKACRICKALIIPREK